MHPTFLASLRDAMFDALAVVLPIDCAGCGTDGRAVCGSCREELQPHPFLSPLDDGTPVWAALHYDAAVRRAILEFKEHGRTDVVKALAVPLASAVASAASHADQCAPGSVELVIPPVSSSSFRRRGYDPLRLLLRAAGLPRPIPALTNLYERESQKTLDRQHRRMNVAGSMAANTSLTGRKLLIIDDVVTTGATLAEVIRALQDGGGEVVGAAVVAATPRYRLGLSSELEISRDSGAPRGLRWADRARKNRPVPPGEVP